MHQDHSLGSFFSLSLYPGVLLNCSSFLLEEWLEKDVDLSA